MAPKNDPTPVSSVRSPRLQVRAAGFTFKGAYEADVQVNNRLQAARFSVSFACEVDEPDHDAKWWGEQKDVPVEVYVGFKENDGEPDWTLLLSGTTDDIHYHPEQGVVRIEGRDLSSRLIDARTRETFTNKTYSEIVEILAGRHGMTADVTPATTTKVGTYYQLEHDKLTADGFSKATTEWDLLVYLAKNENYSLRVDGTVIRSHPNEAVDTSSPYIIYWKPRPDIGIPPEMNAKTLDCSRSLTLAKDVRVTVKTFSSKKNRAFAAVYPQGGSSAGSAAAGGKKGGSNLASKNPVQNYVFLRPGISEAAALQEAQRLHKEITAHERVINLTIAGEIEMGVDWIIQIDGTGTSWDQNYYVDEITRKISWDSGFEQTIRAKNASPQNQANVQ